MRSDGLERGSWWITEVPGGWEFRARYDAPVSLVLTRYLRRNLPFMLVYPALGILILGWLVIGGMPIAKAIAAAPAMVLASILLTLVCWPFRFGRSGGGGGRYRKDGTYDRYYYYLRYGDLKRTIVLRVRDGILDLDRGGIFSPQRLHSLKIIRFDDELAGLVGLEFSGDVVQDQVLLPWPGVDEAVAIRIRTALIERVERAMPVVDGTLTSAST